MNAIFHKLEDLKKEKRIGIMAHVVLGYPSFSESLRLARVLAASGVDFIELQIPFSDPLGDGPTIMKANHAALAGGMSVGRAFEAMREVSHSAGALYGVPMFFMAYFNIVFNFGVEAFCREAARAGASGLIVPDMPVDEEPYEHFYSTARGNGLVPMKFLSGQSSNERITRMLGEGDFLYFFGQQGVTGARRFLDKGIGAHISRIKKMRNVPIAVGFGVSEPQHIVALKAAGADVAVVGSALIDAMNRATIFPKKIELAEKFIKSMVHAVAG